MIDMISKGRLVSGFVRGGGQERGLRSGTLPAAAIAGFGAAADAALADRQTDAATTLTTLRTRLLSGLQTLAPDLQLNGDPTPSGAGLPGLLSVRFPGRRAEDLLLLLDRHGVACSAGSACASGAVTPSHVLVAMGRDPADARETIRFSLGHASTQADVDAAVKAARAAFDKGTWANMPPANRKRIMLKLAELMPARLAQALTVSARDLEIRRAA
jgi:cysteine desulfurase